MDAMTIVFVITFASPGEPWFDGLDAGELEGWSLSMMEGSTVCESVGFIVIGLKGLGDGLNEIVGVADGAVVETTALNELDDKTFKPPLRRSAVTFAR